MIRQDNYEPLKNHLRDLHEDLGNKETKRRYSDGENCEEAWKIESTIEFFQDFYEKLVK